MYDPACITILQWITCLFAYPPCLNYKLLLPCEDACGDVISIFGTCDDVIRTEVDDDPVRLHLRNVRCRIAESFYEGYSEVYFINEGSECFEPRNVLSS